MSVAERLVDVCIKADSLERRVEKLEAETSEKLIDLLSRVESTLSEVKASLDKLEGTEITKPPPQNYDFVNITEKPKLDQSTEEGKQCR